MATLDSVMISRLLAFREPEILVEKNRFIPNFKRNGDSKSIEISFKELRSSMRDDLILEVNKVRVKKNDKLASYIAKTTFVYAGSADSLSYYKNALKEMRNTSRKSYRRLPKTGGNGTWFYGYGVNYLSGLDVGVDDENDRLKLLFTFKDSSVAIPVTLKSSATNLNQRMTVFRNFFKKYDRLKINRSKMWRKQNRDLTRRIKVFENSIKGLLRQVEVQRQFQLYTNEQELKEYKGLGSVRRAFSINSMGVWNCDARSRLRRAFSFLPLFATAAGVIIKRGIKRIMLIDFDRNGVLTFQEGGELFMDLASNSAVVVFFSDDRLGVYKHEANAALKVNEPLKVEEIDISNMEREQLIEKLKNE